MKKKNSQKQEAPQMMRTRNEMMNTSVEICSFKVPLPRQQRVSFCTIFSFMCAKYAEALMKISTVGGETVNVEHTLNVQTL